MHNLVDFQATFGRLRTGNGIGPIHLSPFNGSFVLVVSENTIVFARSNNDLMTDLVDDWLDIP